MQEGWKALGRGTGEGGTPAGLLPSAAGRSGSLAPSRRPRAADLSAPLPAPRLPRAFARFPREGT